MKQIAIGSGLAVPAFEVPTSDPNFWLLRACYEEVVYADRCYSEGVTADYIESADITEAEEVIDGLSDYLKSWLASAMGAAVVGGEIPEIQESYIPELIEFLALAVTGQWGLIFVLFVKVGLKFLLERLRERLGEGAIDDAAETLDKIFLDKSDPEKVRNRLDALNQLVIINPVDVEIDSTDWDFYKENNQ